MASVPRLQIPFAIRKEGCANAEGLSKSGRTCSNDLGKVLLDMSLVAFWGMARLGKLVCDISHGQLEKDKGVWISDVRVASDAQSAWVKIHFAKTATGGETT
ncbi:uncharacterized protein PGTG_14817 [Puccinia graminis f. sp. tritici CRL 75-36-700-3]|uniref:Uncharacterized protein n=1 Tax=Puccinia graminis f. sp. tritici (strain CRL 75-36-700-3 / race SCCL) TaxID=418459 RepID=E3KWD7_PUCGT|nr:uncharacterized protein PGTG_14817 [Puccinia graminis f. sp. tritici CRL 75-36-700-3]EFP88612.2 hypothetical protein PGTG_14817 [Puccinia graminis f. sp. tritici CRL 75-36-700-3]